MTQKPTPTIRLLGANRSYADGAEEDVLSALDRVADHSDGSDELYSQAVDWPTTYHFSPRRSNILRPFEIGKDHRVLEIGAGTGAITRYLGELGAEVTALEGEAIRARAIAARCSDLENVEVVSGSLFDFEDSSGFDLIVIIGVLEYAGPATSDHRHQLDFLRHANGLLRPEGTLVLAIENQIGLKYLLGYSEDHLEQPWVGVEGYPGNPAVCTVPRSTLGSLLDQCGLTAQRWLYPYPDYKLPRAILSEEAFSLPSSTNLVDQLVGRPILDLANPPTRFCDDRACHRVFLDADLGPDVANSFLVAASRNNAAIEGITDNAVLAWHFSSDRLKPWRRTQILERTTSGLRLTARATYPDATAFSPSWIEHDPTKDEEFVRGRTLEQQALESSRNLDPDGLAEVIRRWNAVLAEIETAPGDGHDKDIPFSARPGRAGLPSVYLDASMANFVDNGSKIVFIDREWSLGSQVDATLTRVRALWYLALDLVVSGVAHPFEAHSSVDELAIRLGDLAGLDFDRAQIEEVASEEARIQEMVTGKPAQLIEADLRELGSTTRTAKEASSNLPIAQIRRDLVQLGGLLHGMESQAEHSRRYQASLEKEISTSGSRMKELEGEYRRIASHLEKIETQNREAAEWAKNLETQNQEVTAWTRNLETQNRDITALARDLEAQNREATAWAKDLENQINDATKWATNLEDRIDEAETRKQQLVREAAEAERRIERIRADRTALELRVLSLAREVEELRTWKQRASRRPLVKYALAIHRFFDPVDDDDQG